MARTRDQDARARVLATARELVCANGPLAVSVDEIARSAHVAKQTIYRWWPSKESVLMDALIELTDPDPEPLPGTTREIVALQMRRVAAMFSSRQGELLREVIADLQGDPDLATEFRDRFFAHRRARGAQPILDGMKSGELRSELDVEVVLDALYGPLWLRLLVGHLPMTPTAVDAILDTVWPGLVAVPT
jgi:AcrR family transcriptional regulator